MLMVCCNLDESVCPPTHHLDCGPNRHHQNPGLCDGVHVGVVIRNPGGDKARRGVPAC